MDLKITTFNVAVYVFTLNVFGCQWVGLYSFAKEYILLLYIRFCPASMYDRQCTVGLFSSCGVVKFARHGTFHVKKFFDFWPWSRLGIFSPICLPHPKLLVCPVKGRNEKFLVKGRKQLMCKIVFQENWARKFDRFSAFHKSLYCVKIYMGMRKHVFGVILATKM